MRDIKVRLKNLITGSLFSLNLIENEYLNMVCYAPYSFCGQYTGLKDRNGKEICEGDICSLTSDGPEINNYNTCYLGYTQGYIKYEDGEWLLDTKKYYCYSLGLDYNEVNRDECHTHLNKMTTLEVIGNIYENPELLEKSIGTRNTN